MKCFNATFITVICCFSFQSTIANPLEDSVENYKSDGDITQKYQEQAEAIRSYLVSGEGKGQTYSKLAELTDTYGSRMSYSQSFFEAAEWMMDELRKAGIDKVWTERVDNIPYWTRNQDNPGQAVLSEPWTKNIPVLALGDSAATPPGGISAEVVVVTSFDELDALPDSAVNGKIVVYNQPWQGYGPSGAYRTRGANAASKRGAVAALVRSVASLSLYSLHTGAKYEPEPGMRDIPVASITVEDAELLYNLQQAGHDLSLTLELNTLMNGTASSFNIVAELTGSVYPNETVLFGGHFDSWDVGQGAQDDGGGVAITWQALTTMASLGLRPKRTVRGVFWTAEELKYFGANAYYALHKNEADSLSMVMESDAGTFTPTGIHFTGNDEAVATMRQIVELLKPINASDMTVNEKAPGDPGDFVYNDGIPGVELQAQSLSDPSDPMSSRYFWYHHTEADTMTAMSSTDLDLCATVWTTVAFVVADLDTMLPHGGFTPPKR